MLEAVLSMPSQKVRVRTIEGADGGQSATGSVDHRVQAVRVVRLARHKDLEVVREADQPPIEHPTHGARECQTIRHDVWTIRLHRPDMSGLGFSAAAAVDDPKPGDRAALAIGA